MKITNALVHKVHRLANQKLFKEFPLLDSANSPEGHIKKWAVEYVLDALYEIQREVKK